jgi:predicted nucleic acid-binding protein
LPADLPLLGLDACGVLNLAAVMPLDTIGEGLPYEFVMVDQVAEEVLFLHDLVGDDLVKTPVDSSGVTRVSLAPDELAAYVDLASQLDDGEAATLAAAQSRGWIVLTDDRKATRVAGEMAPPVAVMSTARFIREWAATQVVDPETLSACLQAIEQRANFTPRRQDPDYEWWQRARGLPNAG